MHKVRGRVDHRFHLGFRVREHVHAVRGREVLGHHVGEHGVALPGLHRVRGRQGLGGRGRGVRERLPVVRSRKILGCPGGGDDVCLVPRELKFALRRWGGGRVHVQCGLHGAQRRGVRRVRGGDVQGSCWLCPVRDLRRREVLAPCDDLELFNRLREV
jgi:hypothetical protein